MPQPVSLTRRGIGTGGFRLQDFRAGGDEQLAAPGHGVAGIDRQVKQNLLHHAGVRLDGRQPVRVVRNQGNVLAQDALE